MLRHVDVCFGTVLRIPESWDVFVFRGLLYVKDEWGHFTVRGVVPEGTATAVAVSPQE